MILQHKTQPNICDVCGKKDVIAHFHTVTDEWISLCYECQKSVTSIFFSTSPEKRLKSIMNGLKDKHGQTDIHS